MLKPLKSLVYKDSNLGPIDEETEGRDRDHLAAGGCYPQCYPRNAMSAQREPLIVGKLLISLLKRWWVYKDSNLGPAD